MAGEKTGGYLESADDFRYIKDTAFSNGRLIGRATKFAAGPWQAAPNSAIPTAAESTENVCAPTLAADLHRFVPEDIMSISLRGHFLVAANHLRDSNFYRAVVLMLEHTDDSAMGIVINRPSSIVVDAAMEKLTATPISTEPIFSGGPVETSALFILHNCAELGKHDEEITEGVFVTGSNDSFESLVNKKTSCSHDCNFRIYCGYAGWGPLQLNEELDRGDWRTLPADGSIVFENDPYNIWERCTQELNRQNRFLPHNVENPEWN